MKNSSKLEHSTHPPNNREPRLMFEEFLHLLPRLCQLACGPNCSESGCLQLFPKMGYASERAIKCDTKIGRPIVVPQPFHIYNYVQLWLILALCKWKVLDTVLATLGCSRQRLQYSLILAMSALMNQYKATIYKCTARYAGL